MTTSRSSAWGSSRISKTRTTARPRSRLAALLRERASPLAVFALIVVVATLVAVLLPTYRLRPAPDIAFTLLDGRPLRLAELHGRPVLVNFWSPTCAPCVAELPDLARLHEELAPRGLALVGVATPQDPPLSVQAFARGRRLPYPIALDVDGRVASAFGNIRFIPTTLLIDPEGHIVYRQTGKLDFDRARRIMAPFLKDGAPANEGILR